MLSFSKGSVVNVVELSEIKHLAQSLPSTESVFSPLLPASETGRRKEERRGERENLCVKGFFRFNLEEIMSFHSCSYSLIEFSSCL